MPFLARLRLYQFEVYYNNDYSCVIITGQFQVDLILPIGVIEFNHNEKDENREF